jgi:hypothetical protein
VLGNTPAVLVLAKRIIFGAWEIRHAEHQTVEYFAIYANASVLDDHAVIPLCDYVKMLYREGHVTREARHVGQIAEANCALQKKVRPTAVKLYLLREGDMEGVLALVFISQLLMLDLAILEQRSYLNVCAAADVVLGIAELE